MSSPKIDLEALGREFEECMRGENATDDPQSVFEILAEKGSFQLMIYFIREWLQETVQAIRQKQNEGDFTRAEELRACTMNADMIFDLTETELLHPELSDLIADIRTSLRELQKPIDAN